MSHEQPRYSNAGLSSVPAPERVHNPNLVFVSNISFDCTAAQLQDFFSRVGAVEHCEIKERDGVSKGVGSVLYANAASAARAVSELHQAEFMTRALVVSPRLKKHKKNSHRRARGDRAAEDDTVPEEKAHKERSRNSGRRPNIPFVDAPHAPSDANTLYVGNLSWDVTSEDLEALFNPFGVLVSCDLAVTDSGRTKGFALIKFQDKACAAAAILALHDSEHDGRTIRVRMDGGARLPMPVDDSQVQKQVRSAPVQSARAAVEHADDNTDNRRRRIGHVRKPRGDRSSDAVEHAASSSTSKPRVRAERPARVVDNSPGFTLFVGNLSWETTDAEITTLFAEFGTLIYVKVAVSSSGRSKGFAAVKYVAQGNAIAAMDSLGDFEFNGRKLVVRWDSHAHPELASEQQ